MSCSSEARPPSAQHDIIRQCGCARIVRVVCNAHVFCATSPGSKGKRSEKQDGVCKAPLNGASSSTLSVRNDVDVRAGGGCFANLDQSCRSARSCFQYLHPDTVPLHDERIMTVREEPSLHVNPTSEMSQMERSRCILNRYVERFNVEKCPMRYESIRRISHCVDPFNEFKTARANVQDVKLKPRLRPTVASASREERRSHRTTEIARSMLEPEVSVGCEPTQASKPC